MNKFSKYVGLDTHAKTIAVSIADALGGTLADTDQAGRPGKDRPTRCPSVIATATSGGVDSSMGAWFGARGSGHSSIFGGWSG